MTALMAALVGAPSDVARLMVSKGAKVSATDSRGLDAISYAEAYKSNDKGLIAFLESKKQEEMAGASPAANKDQLPTRCMDYDSNSIVPPNMTINGITYRIVMCQQG